MPAVFLCAWECRLFLKSDSGTIIECDETYVGGKNKNRHNAKKTEGGQGRGGDDKTPIFGMVQRNGKVVAQKVKDVSGKTLKGIIKDNVKEGSQIMTDEWKSYNGLCLLYGHQIVKHSMNEYKNGACHTNTLEGFWSLLKRGVIGQIHYVTPKHLNAYINEFCFRYNERKNLDVFALTIQKAVKSN
ncbi:IS1595 family transposase [bacterium]|nr:MAG: IS1595 family transposase [bacterium]